MIRARLGGQGVRVEGMSLAISGFDLERTFTAQPRRESVIWGGSRAPRYRTPDELPCEDPDDLDGDSEYDLDGVDE